eukprot:CAMPEP_0196730580 /NCGR_PEP_ID=MMETSP1091-20130531/10604_1 /TAXON_ID=302021 /ORGANISM="Rhodomonas sp., Strain CCMP768" /LENGTH=170 /DNA_ID=CAMNT_0042073611 /DNA_START=143 /DNA_END=655 /DNA_ORIENTATION=+
MTSSITPSTVQLEVVFPFRYPLRFAPAWFGNIVLPPDRVQAKVAYGGDACESLVGRVSVRNMLVLVDRGKCSFIQKAVHVEQAGGIGMLVANDSDDYFVMTEDGTGRGVRFSSFLISQSDANILKEELICDKDGALGGYGLRGGGCNPEGKGLYVAWGLGFQTRAHHKVV